MNLKTALLTAVIALAVVAIANKVTVVRRLVS
jgi:hypothetical protein